MKKDEMRGYVARMGEMRNTYKIMTGNLKEETTLEN
jgi:hypothetical protein